MSKRGFDQVVEPPSYSSPTSSQNPTKRQTCAPNQSHACKLTLQKIKTAQLMMAQQKQQPSNHLSAQSPASSAESYTCADCSRPILGSFISTDEYCCATCQKPVCSYCSVIYSNLQCLDCATTHNHASTSSSSWVPA